MAPRCSVNRPLRARYGSRDNMHALLEWEGQPTPPPASLLGLTDKPPGSYAPGDRWWPSVGCGPVEDWWALWWTRPDDHARRAGMVSSEVALWRQDQVGAVEDLRPTMELLAGSEAVLLPSRELLGRIAEALLSSDGGRPVVLNLDMWPGVIAALWVRLWPAVRRNFSARVAVSPPQGGESVTPPWMFGVPPDRAPQWAGHRLITSVPVSIELSRPARWLVGETDQVLDEVLVASTSLPAELGGLRRAARAADRLEQMRGDANPQHALDVLRTVVALAPTSDAALALKAEALRVLARGLADASATLVLSLRNLGASHLPAGLPVSELATWVSNHAPSLPLEEASSLLETLPVGKAEGWWRQVVHQSIFDGLACPAPGWAKAALQWLGLPSLEDPLAALLPATEGVEQRLLDSTGGVVLPEAALKRLRQRAVDRRWSRLHAWAAMKGLPPHDAFDAQQSFPGDAISGLALLVERLPGATVVAEAISVPSAVLTKLVAQRTAREPNLLRSLDARTQAWRALWSAHVAAGGSHWPPESHREVLGRGILDATLKRDEPGGLIAALA